METNRLPEILTLEQFAAFLSVHPSTIYRLPHLERRQILAFKIGSDWRFSRARTNQ